MLRKEDIINILNEYDFPADQYWVLAGSGLVMHEVREETSDIDLGCTTEFANKLVDEGCFVREEQHHKRVIEVGEHIEVFENWNVEEIDLIYDIPVGSLNDIRKHKEELGREKDITDIDLIDEYLERQI